MSYDGPRPSFGLPPSWMDEFRRRYDAGETRALFDAISSCLAHGIKAPDWVWQAYHVAWLKWSMADCRTLDEAFGVARPKGWSRKRAKKDAYVFVLWNFVVKYRRENPETSITRDLFEAVAEKLNEANADMKVNATDVQSAYYAVQNIGKKEKT